LQKLINSFEQNSLPLSNQSTFIFLLASFSTIDLNALNSTKALSFFFKKHAHIFLEKSLTKSKNYLALEIEVDFIGLQISQWTSSSTALALQALPSLKANLCCFPVRQATHMLLFLSI
jgi:hypothetical protein